VKPRALRLLRVEDEVPDRRNDIIYDAPVEILPPIQRWLDFCNSLANRQIPRFELLTIDFNFNKDQSSPRFPPPSGAWEVDPDFAKDDLLNRLGWSSRLRESGKNSGLVIGATLIGLAVYRDLPVGAATYTGYPDIPTCDVTSALLLAQILAVSGELRQFNSAKSLLRHVVETAMNGSRTPHTALPEAVRRFRSGFVQRACSTSQHHGMGSLWVKLESVWWLQAALKAKTDNEFRSKVGARGLEFYDRNGRLDSLSLDSLFLDVTAVRDADEQVSKFRPGLLLTDVQPDTAGRILVQSFLEELANNAITNVRSVVAFLEHTPSETINDKFHDKARRLIGLLFACCNQFAERYLEYGRPWNSLKWEADAAGDFAPLNSQLRSLLRLLPQEALPLSATNSDSIMKRVHDACTDNEDHPLTLALGYDDPFTKKRDLNLAQQRYKAISNMLHILVTEGCVTEENNLYTLRTRKLPDALNLDIDRQDLDRRLGFPPTHGDKHEHATKHLNDIVRAALDQDLQDFVEALESRTLPEHLRWLCSDYMRNIWPTIPESNWPECLKKTDARKKPKAAEARA
jgi:hypothetical protein